MLMWSALMFHLKFRVICLLRALCTKAMHTVTLWIIWIYKKWLEGGNMWCLTSGTWPVYVHFCSCWSIGNTHGDVRGSSGDFPATDPRDLLLSTFRKLDTLQLMTQPDKDCSNYSAGLLSFSLPLLALFTTLVHAYDFILIKINECDVEKAWDV